LILEIVIVDLEVITINNAGRLVKQKVEEFAAALKTPKL
jgi:hypothetical protein